MTVQTVLIVTVQAVIVTVQAAVTQAQAQAQAMAEVVGAVLTNHDKETSTTIRSAPC